MLTLEEFKKYIEIIENFENQVHTISDMIITECTGFIDFHFTITRTCVELLEKVMGDKGEWISWFLYEFLDRNDDKECGQDDTHYNLKTVDDLYYFLTKQYDKVTKWVE